MLASPFIQNVRARWQVARDNRVVVYAAKAVRIGFVVAVVAYLFIQLRGLGWENVWQNLPTHPLYYALLLALYALLPITEAFVYSRLWGVGVWECVKVSLQKRTLNRDVLGYSGEVYLYAWGRKRVAGTSWQLLGTLKDNLLMSSAASITTAFIMLGALAALGQVSGVIPELPSYSIWIVIGIAALLLAGGGVASLRSAVFTSGAPMLRMMYAAHIFRFILGWILQVLQWEVVVPEVTVSTWILLLAAMVVVNRIPFIPSSDLLFIGVGTHLAAGLQMPIAAVTAMLLVRIVAEKLLNVMLFAATSISDDHVSPEAAELHDLGTDADPLEVGPEKLDGKVAA